MTPAASDRRDEHHEHAAAPEAQQERGRAAAARRASAVMPTTARAGTERDRRVSERGLHERSPAFFVSTFGRRVVGAVPDQDAVGVERRVAAPATPSALRTRPARLP